MPDSDQTNTFLSQSWDMRKQWLRDLRVSKQKCAVDRGSSFVKARKLFKLKSILEPVVGSDLPPQRSDSHKSMCSVASRCFGERWNASDTHKRGLIATWLSQYEGCRLELATC